MTKIFGLRIMKETEYFKDNGALTKDSYDNGYSNGMRDGKRIGANELRDKLESRTNRRLNKASVKITNVKLADNESSLFNGNTYTRVTHRVAYDVTFRTKDGELETDIRLYFDDYDVSMSDIQREIKRKICGGGCE